MSDTEIVERHRSELREARAQMEAEGTDPWSKDGQKIFWAINDRHKTEWSGKVAEVKAEEAVERRAEAAASAPIKAINACKTCGAEIPRTGHRGRPAQVCAACKTQAPTSQPEAKSEPQEIIILGPNLGIPGGTTFHVHAVGCADLTKPKYRRVVGPGGENYTETFESQREVVEFMYSDQMAENDDEWSEWEPYESEFTFFPCVHLPREAK